MHRLVFVFDVLYFDPNRAYDKHLSLYVLFQDYGKETQALDVMNEYFKSKR